MPAEPKSLRHAVAGFIVVVTLAGAGIAAAATQSWVYKSYYKDPTSGQFRKELFREATISIEEDGGKASFRMVTPGRGDPCYNRGALPAEVQRDEKTTTITVTPTVTGCEPFRYIIRNDGSGGERYNPRDGGWKPDGFDHGLTPIK